MPIPPPATLAHQDVRDTDRRVLLNFAWAGVGGSVVLAACSLLLTLSVTWGGLLPGLPMPDGSVGPIPTYSSGLASAFMTGSLLVLVARSLSDRKR